MKYYVYISDAKVDMLLPQIPHGVKKKVATEFGFDWKIVSAKRKVERENDEDRISRLETVLAFIREFGNLGTADEPDHYIEDTLPMKYGPMDKRPDGKLTFFGGRSEKSVLALFGSSIHMIGEQGSGSLQGLQSGVNALLMYLSQEKRMIRDDDVFRSVYSLTTQMKGPEQNLDFLAKRLLWQPNYRLGSGPSTQVILASPLYVALAE